LSILIDFPLIMFRLMVLFSCRIRTNGASAFLEAAYNWLSHALLFASTSSLLAIPFLDILAFARHWNTPAVSFGGVPCETMLMLLFALAKPVPESSPLPRLLRVFFILSLFLRGLGKGLPLIS
jgi:hypothetical protein